MSSLEIIGAVSIIVAGLTITIGSIAPALAQGRAITQALAAKPSSPTKPPPLPAPFSSAWP